MSDAARMPEILPPPPRPAGLLARFDGPESLRAAAARIRQEGYTRFDAMSPFPIHGMERAMGIRPTVLPWLVLAAGLAGAAGALLLQWWTNAVNYPLIISGKPLFSLPANIPIVFELIVLFAALAAFGGTLGLNRLPQFWHPVFGGAGFARVTSDGFFLFVDAADRKYDEAALRRLAQSLGAASVESCFEPVAGRAFPKATVWIALVAILLSTLPVLWIARSRLLKSPTPRLDIFSDMDFQPKYKPQAASGLFADGRAMRPPVPGTVRWGGLEGDDHLYRGNVRRQVGRHLPHDPRPRHDGARTGAIQYLLRRLPRLDRRGRRPDLRVGGQARPGGNRRRSQADLGQADLAAIEGDPRGARRRAVPRDYQRPPQDALLCRPDPRARPLGHRPLRPRPPAEPERHDPATCPKTNDRS